MIHKKKQCHILLLKFVSIEIVVVIFNLEYSALVVVLMLKLLIVLSVFFVLVVFLVNVMVLVLI